MASWLLFGVAHSLRIDSDMFVVRALKISQLTDGGMPPTYDSMHQFPIFAGARVYPDLIGRGGFGRSLCLSDSQGLLALQSSRQSRKSARRNE